MAFSLGSPRKSSPIRRGERGWRGFKWLTSMGSNPQTRVGEGRALPPRPSLPANTKRWD